MDEAVGYYPQPLFEHQKQALELCLNKRAFALFDEQGLGKSATLIANAAALYNAQKITGLLVVAPNDVHVQWVVEQLPRHWPVPVPYSAGYWRSGIGKKAYTHLQTLALRACDGCPVLTINYEALATKRAFELIKLFLTTGPTMMIADESHYIKTPAAGRTRLMQRLAPLAYVRRIASGTPAESPFDYYSQMKWLHPHIWGLTPEGRPIGKLEFRHRYGEFETAYTYAGGAPREYENLLRYKNLDDLTATIRPYMIRRTKEECLDLPPKLYSTAVTHLSKKQADAYATLKAHGMLLLEAAACGGEVDLRDLKAVDEKELAEILASSPQTNVVMPKIKLTMLLRLQQIVGGHITDNAGNVRQLETNNPRLERTEELVKAALAAGEKVIIWAQRTAEIDMVTSRLQGTLLWGGVDPSSVAKYDGSVDPKQRLELRTRFQDKKDKLRVLVCQPQAAGTGLNLTAATTVVYYTNGYSYIQRQQSEDRVHRIGTTGTVNIYDLRASDAPCDATLLNILRNKQSMAQAIFGTTVEEWRDMI